MKKITCLLASLCLAVAFTSCDDKLDTENYTKANTGNFPVSENDVTNELAALYSIMNQANTSVNQLPYFVDEVMSDNCYAGGGATGDQPVKATEHFTMYDQQQYGNFWKFYYQGIQRANSIIGSIDNVAWGNDKEARDQALGEAYFMRGYYYLALTQHFGDIPLITSTNVPDPCPDASAENEIYPQILADFTSAANLCNQKISGHANKYAAEGYLARAYMFYEGFYKNAGELATANPAPVALPAQEGVSDGQTLSKSDVVNALQDIINNGGYKLLPDYRSLWQYSNRITQQDYDYTKDLPADQTFKNDNDEEIFQVRFGNAVSWLANYATAYSNQVSITIGLRCDGDAAGSADVNGKQNTFPFGQGWGQAPASANIWNDWTAQEQKDGVTDVRKKASIIDEQNDLQHYVFTTSASDDAGYASKKYMSVTALRSLDGNKVNDFGMSDNYTWWCFESGWGGKKGAQSYQEDNFEDYYLLRYADVLLMQTELTGDASYMNQVRKRAGLPDKPYSWENIQNERRWELAFEGLRYQDLRRWSGINADENSLVCRALQAQDNQRVNLMGTWTTLHHMTSSWAKRYVETKGFLPKPQNQVSLANGAMKQNAGWDTPDAQYNANFYQNGYK